MEALPRLGAGLGGVALVRLDAVLALFDGQTASSADEPVDLSRIAVDERGRMSHTPPTFEQPGRVLITNTHARCGTCGHKPCDCED